MPELNLTILSKLRQPTAKRVKRVSIVGQKFHRLTVYALMGYIRTRQQISYWLCRCECGNWSVVARPKLQKGYIKSCGCYNLEQAPLRSRTHGMRRTRTYGIWVGMISRCHNLNDENYPNWGGRGIYVCDRWRYSFENFFADMGEPPAKHSIDRTDNDGPYSPENCEWADKYRQARNTRRNHYLTAQGQTYCAAEWAVMTGISSMLILRRIRRGWNPDEALEFKERPPRNYR